MVNQFNPDYDPSICEKIPSLFENGASITKVAVDLGIARSTLYKWCDDHPEFKEAIERGKNKSESYLENIAINGVTGGYENFSASMLIFMLKCRHRETYGEQKEDKEKSAGDTLLEQVVNGKTKIVTSE